MERFVKRRAYFCSLTRVNFRSKVFVSGIESFTAEAGVGQTGSLDAVFCLDRGCPINFGDGTGALKIRHKGNTLSGWAQPDGGTLQSLITWLSLTMPTIVSFQSILPLYLSIVKV
jgi:hypothetical protein